MMFIRLTLVAFFAAAVSAQTDTARPDSARRDAARDALFSALQRGAAGEVGRLLTSGVSADEVDAEGTPALMAAALFTDAW